MNGNDLRSTAAEIRENPMQADHVFALAVADWLDETARQLEFWDDGARVDLRFVTRARAVAKAWRGES
jgi:hypothetical protein